MIKLQIKVKTWRMKHHKVTDVSLLEMKSTSLKEC